jgi:hypothetical protein
VREQDVVATIDAESCARDIVDYVVEYLYVVGLVAKPRTGHIL